MSDIAKRVKEIVAEQLGVEAAQVVPEASFMDDLGADSLDTVELVMALEEEFGIEIPDDGLLDDVPAGPYFEIPGQAMDIDEAHVVVAVRRGESPAPAAGLAGKQHRDLVCVLDFTKLDQYLCPHGNRYRVDFVKPFHTNSP